MLACIRFYSIAAQRAAKGQSKRAKRRRGDDDAAADSEPSDSDPEAGKPGLSATRQPLTWRNKMSAPLSRRLYAGPDAHTVCLPHYELDCQPCSPALHKASHVPHFACSTSLHAV